jgi:uncharacterized protein YlxW (UPF0749 family)
MSRPLAQWSVAVVCALLGLALVTQLRTYHVVVKAGLSPADQAVVINSLVDGNAAIRREIEEIEQKLDALQQPESASGLAAMERELAQLRIVTGAAPVTGPGVEVYVGGYVKPEDLGDLLNELRNAGAEVTAVNGVRLGTRSVFTFGSAGYQVEGQEIAAPMRFVAIGTPSTLETALNRKGGVVSLLRNYYPHLTFEVGSRERITVPAQPTSPGQRLAES